MLPPFLIILKHRSAMSNNEVRICFAVDPELKERLKDKIPWGDVKKIFVPMTEQLVELLEEHDPEMIKAGIISKKFPLAKIIDFNKNEDKDAAK